MALSLSGTPRGAKQGEGVFIHFSPALQGEPHRSEKSCVFARILMRAKTQTKELSLSLLRVIFYRARTLCGTLTTNHDSFFIHQDQRRQR